MYNLIKDVDVSVAIQNMTLDKNIEEDKTIKDNNEILINYVIKGKIWNRTNVVDNICAYNVTLDKLCHDK